MEPIIRIIAVGGLKERCLLQAEKYYLSRLKPMYNISVIELPDEPAPDYLSAAGRQAVLACEGRRIISRFMPSNVKASLAVSGIPVDMAFFRNLIYKPAMENRRLDFIIGGSLGLSENVLRQSDYKISLSRFTFPHRLSRLILLEILLQANIAGGEPT